MTAPLLQVEQLYREYTLPRESLWGPAPTVQALNGVSFTIEAGRSLGIVGESGSGKSTLARLVMALDQPTRGSVRLLGRDLHALPPRELREARRDMQMVFQDPYASLNPRMTVFDTLAEPLLIHGVEKRGAGLEDRVRKLMRQVGLSPAYMRRYPHEFSGGQRQRIGIARAVALKPKLVLLDEPVSALDVSIQAQIINLLVDLQKELGLTYVFVAHDLAVVRHVCSSIAVMYLGRIVERATSPVLFMSPKHPYTQALLSAIPVPDPVVERKRKRLVLTGEVPSPLHPPPGCHFHTRCPIAFERCKKEVPRLREAGNGHLVACHAVEERAGLAPDLLGGGDALGA